MRKLIAAAAVGLVVSISSLPAWAQNNAGQANFGNLIAALNNVNAQINQINALNNIDVSRVHIVDVDDVLNGNNVQAFNNALNQNDVTVLQNFLNNNTVLNGVLNNANVALTDVVAVNVLSGGDIVIFRR